MYTHIYIYIYIYVHTHVYIYIYICIGRLPDRHPRDPLPVGSAEVRAHDDRAGYSAEAGAAGGGCSGLG